MSPEDFKRKLTAVLSADVAGYSRLMAEDETTTVKTLAAYRGVMASLIKQHRGRVVDSPGDNVLAEFTSVVDAVQCAVSVQKELQTRNAQLPEGRRMEFRIGINLGDVIEEGDRIYGDGVNIAARLEALSDPGGICVSKTAFDHIESKLPLGYEYLGEQEVKNIPKPVGVYRVLMEPRIILEGKKEDAKVVSFSRRKAAIVGVIAVLVVIIGAAIWSFYLRPPPIEPASAKKMAYPLPEKPSLAVLPFVNMSDDPKQEYFSDGITENIIMALSKTPKLFVIARNSTFAYKDKPFNIKQVAEELGVRYILEGSVQKTENRVRITAQLIDAATGRHQWAERYDRELKHIFALHDEITLEIITALQVELTEGEQSRIHRGGTTNLEAFLKILKGREHHFRYTKEDNEIAKRTYREAIALDPKYATAYFWLAYAIDADIGIGWSKSREKDIERLFELSEKILALDDSSALAHIVFSRYYRYTGQLDRAIAEAEKAIALDPNNADGYAFLGLLLQETQRAKEAIQRFKEAMHLNPIPPVWYPLYLGYCYLLMGNYEEAITAFKKTINVDPINPVWLALCSYVLSMTGKHEEAIAMIKKAIDLGPSRWQNLPREFSLLAEYYRRVGQYEEAIDTSRKLIDSNPTNKYAIRAYITLTCAYSALGSEGDARAAAAEVLRISPNFSLEDADAAEEKAQRLPISYYDWFLKHEADKDLLVNALRKAGLK